MGNCGSCRKGGPGGESGCESHKGPQRAALDAAMRRVYPTGRWGELDDEARFEAGLSRAEVRRLGRALSVAVRAPTLFRSGGAGDRCDFLYVLCVGREPSLLDVREGVVPLDACLGAVEGGRPERLEERHLRIACSSVARLACVQEVALSYRGDEGLIREEARSGVYDPSLLKRMRAVVDLVEASDVEHVDFGLLDRPADGVDGAAYEAEWGMAPHLVNWLFYDAPTGISASVWVGEARLEVGRGATIGVDEALRRGALL